MNCVSSYISNIEFYNEINNKEYKFVLLLLSHIDTYDYVTYFDKPHWLTKDVTPITSSYVMASAVKRSNATGNISH